MTNNLRLMTVGCVALMGISGPAQADIATSRQTCTEDQTATVTAAIATAKKGLGLTIASINSGTDVDITRFTRWFGPPSSDAADKVRQVFERAFSVIDTQVYWCPVANSEELQFYPTDPAAAYPKGSATEIFFGPYYFELPDTGENSKAGVFVHELTHLGSVGPTGDRAINMTESEVLAETDPKEARNTANNYEFFFEDTLFGLTSTR